MLASLMHRVGPCTLAPRRGYFVALCRAIFTQQLSMAVARVLFKRFCALFPGGRPTPAGVLALSDEQLASIGLSRQKRTYLCDLASHFASGAIPVNQLSRMDDEQVIARLMQVKGIGRWTAEMFLIFVLNRPDLFPVDDLGIRKSIMRHWRLGVLPEADQLLELAEPWRPWRTVATWYLWRAAELEPAV